MATPHRPARVTFAAVASVWLGLMLVPSTIFLSAWVLMAESSTKRVGLAAVLVACAASGASSTAAGVAMFHRRAWGRLLALVLMPGWCTLFFAFAAWFAFAKMRPSVSQALQDSAGGAYVGTLLVAVALVGIGLYGLIPAAAFLQLRHDEAAAWFRLSATDSTGRAAS